ncbi:MAG: hypothetical protein MZU95_10910 [Desulfomicrobium escambiense]|nr:hypothetical protein [Desulfomicrobium escambiense]
MFIATAADRAAERASCIVIRDEGAGIRADDLPRIREPFFTTKQDIRRHRPGAVHLVPDRRGAPAAAMQFSSEPGVGTTVDDHASPRRGAAGVRRP